MFQNSKHKLEDRRRAALPCGDTDVRDEMKPHPFADIFPLLEGEAFDALVADIKANGLMELITIYEDMVLDGRNRLRACKVAGVEPEFMRFDGDDPLAFVLSMNLHRRHLTPSQCSMVARTRQPCGKEPGQT